MSGKPKSPARRLGAFRARLAARQDTEHEMSLNRVAIVLIALGYVLIAHSLGFADATAALAYGQILCAVYLVASLLIFAHIVARPGVSHVRRHVALALDMTTLSLGMHIGDSAFALGYPIYLWVIFGNGFRFGVGYLFRATLCGAIGFGLMAMHTPIWIRDTDLTVGLFVGLIVLPAYVSVLIRKLSEAKRQAEEASKAKSMFLASVSHELRTPLNAIISFSDLLKIARLDREHREMAATIGDSGRSLLGLINNILDFSRIEAGKQPVRIGLFDLAACLERTRRVLAVQADAKSIYLNVWIGPDLPLNVIGSEQELQQILLNLAGNAVKFTRHGGVTIAARREERGDGHLWLRIDVTDTGIGIAREAQARIFESFSQADDTIIDRFGGTGLGLAIVRQLVERHGGAVSLTSEPGRGSTFSFTLRLSEGVAAGAAPVSRQAIIVTHHPGLAVQFGRFGAKPQWATSVSAARVALSGIDEYAPPPVVIFDRETMSEAAFGNMGAVLQETGRHVVVGVLSDTPDDVARTAGFPMTFSIPAPGAEGDWSRLAHAGQIAAPSEETSAGGRIAPLNILVAEDNVTNQQVARKLLEREGHSVTVVVNGEDAVEALEKQAFDLVLMDINMPVMNGFEATKLHRFASLGRRRVPIYALTADVTDDTREKAAEAGMDGCLHKPIERAELDTVLAAAAPGRADREKSQAAGRPHVAPTADQTPEQSAADEPIDFAAVPLVDAGALAVLADLGGVEFVDDLAVQFVADAWRKLDDIGFAVADGDAQAFREVTHSLRSSAANLGARRLFAMCLEWRALDRDDLVAQGEQKLALLRATLLETEADLAAASAELQLSSKKTA
jgi:two-component system sensor histidine kinase RpfC